jgi:3',5'-cyclic AMP phosphodiesterase CpdA
MLDSPRRSGGCDGRVLFVSDTHIGFDWPTRPRIVRRRRGDDFFQNFERALEPARKGEVDVVVHGGDLLYRSRVPAWLAETALAPLKRLASSGVPVLLVPGNHERGRIPYPLLAVDEDLHVFDRPRSVVLDAAGVRVAFIGFPYAVPSSLYRGCDLRPWPLYLPLRPRRHPHRRPARRRGGHPERTHSPPPGVAAGGEASCH